MNLAEVWHRCCQPKLSFFFLKVFGNDPLFFSGGDDLGRGGPLVMLRFREAAARFSARSLVLVQDGRAESLP